MNDNHAEETTPNFAEEISGKGIRRKLRGTKLKGIKRIRKMLNDEALGISQSRRNRGKNERTRMEECG